MKKDPSYWFMELENHELLRRAVPPLARQFGFSSEEAWALLENPSQTESLTDLLSRWQDPNVRHQVNQWWTRHHREFPQLGLGVLQQVRSASKVESKQTYQALICLVFLTKALQAERARRLWEVPTPASEIPPVVPMEFPATFEIRPTFWQQIFHWIRNLLSR